MHKKKLMTSERDIHGLKFEFPDQHLLNSKVISKGDADPVMLSPNQLIS